MNLRTKANLAIAAFMCACLFPAVGMLLLPEGQATANQRLAPVPTLTTADGKINLEVFQQATDYIADHFAFRQQMITANAALNAALFHVSTEDSVLLGKEGWLFYQQTAADYLHTEPLSQRQLYGAAHTIALMQEYLTARGIQLFVTVAPNKASLYPEYLPDIGQPLDRQADIDRLTPLLSEEGIAYVDLFAALRDQRAQDDTAVHEFLYHRLDSHWNARGAALAHDTLMSALGKTDQTLFFPGDYVFCQNHKGDLYEMLYPAGKELDENVQYQREPVFSYSSNFHSVEDQYIETQNPLKSGSLFMFRDSFGNALYPFLADAYGHCIFSRAMPYQLSLLDASDADTIIIEIVERNLDWLATRAPIFPAPLRILSQMPPIGQAEAAFSITDDGMLEGYLQLTGTLSGKVDAHSPIYIQLDDMLYEASPAGQGEIPFTAYVPRAAYQQAAVLYFADGILYQTPYQAVA